MNLTTISIECDITCYTCTHDGVYLQVKTGKKSYFFGVNEIAMEIELEMVGMMVCLMKA